MRSIKLVTLLALTVVAITVPSKSVHAQAFEPQATNTKQITKFLELNSLLSYKLAPEPQAPYAKPVDKPKPVEIKKPEPPAPVEYTVVEGDNLTKIADSQNTTWQRLWQKNTQVANQDVINIGDKLVIPAPDEVLADRAIVLPIAVQSVSETPQIASYTGSSAGNTYDRGYCTWYVKNRRPDLPNQLGNAGNWYASAKARGLATGTEPRAGAVGVSFGGYYGHVVYVESVNGGTVNISEMNYVGWNVVSTRSVPASSFVYIY